MDELKPLFVWIMAINVPDWAKFALLTLLGVTAIVFRFGGNLLEQILKAIGNRPRATSMETTTAGGGGLFEGSARSPEGRPLFRAKRHGNRLHVVSSRKLVARNSTEITRPLLDAYRKLASEGGAARLEIDLRGCEYLNSSAFTGFLSFTEAARAHGGTYLCYRFAKHSPLPVAGLRRDLNMLFEGEGAAISIVDDGEPCGDGKN